MPFGKYKGQSIKDVPLEYLHWCITEDTLLDSYPEVLNYIIKLTARETLKAMVQHNDTADEGDDLDFYSFKRL